MRCPNCNSFHDVPIKVDENRLWCPTCQEYFIPVKKVAKL